MRSRSCRHRCSMDACRFSWRCGWRMRSPWRCLPCCSRAAYPCGAGCRACGCADGAKAKAATMMQTLRRYLWREIAGATVFVLLALVGVFALFDIINQLADVGRDNYRFGIALVFVALLVPAHAYELMPIAALIGTIYALSKLA